MQLRSRYGVLVAEFLGTAFLASIVLAQVNATGSTISSPWFIGVSAGIALAVMCLVIGKVSGAHLNPAVTLGLWTLKKIPASNAVAYIASQILGGAFALWLFEYISNSTVGNVAGSFAWETFVAEMIGTFVFTFGVAAAISHGLDGIELAFTVGASLALGVIVASTAGNAILNPAVALGLNSWSWTYAAAPLVGSVLAMNTYNLLFAPLNSSKNKK